MLLERKKVHVAKQLERQGKVGFNLSRLKIAREQIEKVLVETQEFNERIMDPNAWQKKVRKRQSVEMESLQAMRNHKRAAMILNQTFELDDQKTEEKTNVFYKRKMT